MGARSRRGSAPEGQAGRRDRGAVAEADEMDGLARNRVGLMPVVALALLSPFLYDVWSWLAG